jgi:hypothetical protein
MQVGRDRRGRGHRVGQPEMERELRRFGESAREEQDQDRDIERIGPDLIAHGQDDRQLERPRDVAQQDHARQQREAPRARQQERLQRRAPRFRAVAVEPDQQVGGDRRDLPEHEERDEVVGQDKAQHPHHEQHQEQDEARVFRVIAEVFRGIERHQRPDPRDQQTEGQAQPVDQDRQADVHRRHPVDAEKHLLPRRDGGRGIAGTTRRWRRG